MSAVSLYSTTLFGFAGFSDAILGTVILQIVNLACTILASYLVDLYGRRILGIVGTIMMSCSMLVLSLVLWFGDSLGQMQGTIAVLMLIVFVAGFASGVGSIQWLSKFIL